MTFSGLLKTPFFVVFLFTFLLGCKGSDTQPDATARLVSSALKAQYTKDQLATRLAAINPLLAGFAKYGVKVYTITYKTKLFDSTEVQASGALIVPDAPTAVAMVSQQHGTITTDDDAPSNYLAGSEAYSIATGFASVGYIMACPDYIGYGASKAVAHTYEQRQVLAQASLDMLRAAREFCKQNSVNWDDRVYLTGYSEGGFATMSLFKMMQEQFPTEFNIRAVTCGAGAYNKTHFMNFLINNTTSGSTDFNLDYVWVVRTYNDLYKLNHPMSYYFKEPYATEAAKGLSGNIGVSLNLTFNDTFKKGVNDGTDKGFINAVADNNVYDWKPTAPLQLYHGDADPLVFYFNSTDAYDAMKKRGATNVNLVTIPGGTHFSSVSSYILGTYDFFSSNK